MDEQDEGYDLLQDGEQPLGEGEEAGEDGAQTNGMNGIESEQEMANGDDEAPASAPTGIVGERQPNKERITTPYLTKYERARILGTRALQIR